MITIVEETAAHHAAREALLDRVFGAGRFMKTCERLREGRLPSQGLAFTMLEGDTLIGTIRLWDVSAGSEYDALMLGPVAIACSHQGRGLGHALIRHALEAVKAAGHGAVILVGDAPYYARFGFNEAVTANLWMPGPVERERFLGLELRPGALARASGFVLPTGAIVPKPKLADLIADFALAA
ncbi:MAG: N-acetyltransferase [Beijerinckiaceae bacterium]|nr:N-acetyltransferase [Beijerinckiaceae bacterium]